MKMKRILALVLALTLCVALAACEKKADNKQSGDPTYKVAVVDALGQPCTEGVIVRFMKDGTQVAMQVVNESGVAEKALAKDTYTVELQFTDTEGAYHYTAGTVTPEAPETQIMLFNAIKEDAQAQNLFAYSLVAQNKVDMKAFPIVEGGTYVQLTKGERNYFVFAPTQQGTYKFSLQQGEGTVGYYGASHFVQDYSVEGAADGAVSVSVRPDGIGTVLVFGVDANSETGVLLLERTGEYKREQADEPWTPYQTTHTPTKYTLPEGAKLTYVDIFDGKTEDYQLVIGEDGFYHLGTADGPLMLINLGKEAPNLSLEIMINGDGVAGGAPLRKYFYNENKEFVKKEDYTEIMITYFEAADEETRLYPLTADLEYMIKNGGEGWWDATHPNYIFDGCNPEIGWLFACCYIN